MLSGDGKRMPRMRRERLPLAALWRDALLLVAEGEGFEPSRRYNRLRDFQSRALGQAMRPFRDWHNGGEGGIRTHEAHHLTLFESAAIVHSATSPRPRSIAKPRNDFHRLELLIAERLPPFAFAAPFGAESDRRA